MSINNYASFLPPAPAAPFSPTDLANLGLWLKADALVLSDNDNVTTWTDSSGNGNNAVSDGTPAIYKTNIVNGKPVVRFAGASPYILSDINPTSVSVFCVFIRRGDIASECFITNTDGASGAQGWALGISDGSANVPKFYVVASSVEGSAMPLDTAQILCGTDSAGTGTLYQDGVQTATGAAQDPITYGVPTILGAIYMSSGGAPYSQYTSGDIAEVIEYNRLLNGTERGQVTTYLKSKYGIA